MVEWTCVHSSLNHNALDEVRINQKYKQTYFLANQVEEGVWRKHLSKGGWALRSQQPSIPGEEMGFTVGAWNVRTLSESGKLEQLQIEKDIHDYNQKHITPKPLNSPYVFRTMLGFLADAAVQSEVRKIIFPKYGIRQFKLWACNAYTYVYNRKKSFRGIKIK